MASTMALLACGLVAAAVSAAAGAKVDGAMFGIEAAIAPAGTRESFELEYLGKNRTYVLYTPPTYNASAPTPVVLNIHGAGSSPYIHALWTGFDVVADEFGFLIAYPKGDPRTFCCGNACFCNDENNDVGLMRLIIDDVASRRNVSRRHVYSTGHSNGGYMSYRLACSASDLVAAVAPVSAGSPFLNFETGCFPSRAVPVLTLHGNADDVVPYADGEAVFKPAGRPFTDPSGFRTLNNCIGNPTVSLTSGDTVCQGWTQCNLQGNGQATNMTFCTTEGASHFYWPGSPIPTFNQDIPSSYEIWRFFSGYSL